MTRNGKHTGGTHLLEGMPQTLVHGAEEGANKVAEVMESASARMAKGAGQVAKGAGQVAKGAGQASGIAAGLSGQVKGRRARMAGAMLRRRPRIRPSGDALLKAQLVKTSRELAHESSDLGAAVESLNKIIRSNRRAAAKGRTRLLGGLALGATLMYHLDAEHGRERRAATARWLSDVVQGRRPPQAPIV